MLCSGAVSGLGRDPENGRNGLRLQQRLHLRVARGLFEARRSVQHFRQKVAVTGGINEYVAAVHDPVNGFIDVGLVFERLVPGVAVFRCSTPRSTSDRFDGLNRDVAFFAQFDNRFKVAPVSLVCIHQVVERHQHRVKIKTVEGAAVHRSDSPAVTCDANEPS